MAEGNRKISFSISRMMRELLSPRSGAKARLRHDDSLDQEETSKDILKGISDSSLILTKTGRHLARGCGSFLGCNHDIIKRTICFFRYMTKPVFLIGIV